MVNNQQSILGMAEMQHLKAESMSSGYFIDHSNLASSSRDITKTLTVQCAHGELKPPGKPPAPARPLPGCMKELMQQEGKVAQVYEPSSSRLTCRDL